MDDPVKDIERVVRSLTQGSPNEQAAAVNRYFVPDAEFVHPFCRVPPFKDVSVSVPLLGGSVLPPLNSRMLLLAVLRWYRILSPRIDLRLNSVLFDRDTNKLYLDITQRFAFWFVPLAAADVNLVTRLSLVETGDGADQGQDQVASAQPASADKPNHGHGLAEEIQNGELPSFAAVAASSSSPPSSANKPLLASHHSNTSPQSRSKNVSSSSGGRYLIAKQEDLYQTTSLAAFLLPFGVGEALVSAWQLFASFLCLVGAAALFPFVWVLTRGGEGGDVKPPVAKVEDDGTVVYGGVGAEWAGRKLSPLHGVVGRVVGDVKETTTALATKGQALASEAQSLTRKAARDVRAREEALVSEARRAAGTFVRDAQERGGQALAAPQRAERDFVARAQEKEEEIVGRLQAGEERVVGQLQAAEERGVENTRAWWAGEKKG